MTKVHPNSANAASPVVAKSSERDAVACSPAALTVWKKSLLFNCDGFTVFDAKGNLMFRVDNYMSGNKGEIVLMDASGNSLLTIRRKKLSLGDSWVVFEGETDAKPRYSVKKLMNLLNKKCMAQVRSAGRGKQQNNDLLYKVEGSYAQRCCAVYDEKRRLVAEIKQKEAAVKGVAFGMDVFRLIVQPQIDTADAMAIVILLDQMFGSSASKLR